MFTSGLLRSFRASMSHADHSPCPPTSVLTARTNLWTAPFSCVHVISTPIQFDISVCHHIIQFSRMGRNGSFQNSTWQFDNSAYMEWSPILKWTIWRTSSNIKPCLNVDWLPLDTQVVVKKIKIQCTIKSRAVLQQVLFLCGWCKRKSKDLSEEWKTVPRKCRFLLARCHASLLQFREWGCTWWSWSSCAMLVLVLVHNVIAPLVQVAQNGNSSTSPPPPPPALRGEA